MSISEWGALVWHHVLTYGVPGFGLLVVATVVFDIVHYVLHRFHESRIPLLHRIGALHQTHHDFYDQQLRFNESLTRRNLLEHVFPEFLTRIAVSLVGLLFVPAISVGLVLAIQLIQLVVVTLGRGRDPNHVAVQTLPAPGSSLYVGLPYHGLHHIHPNEYYASFLTLFDRVMGTGYSVRGRRVALTGASGAFGAPLKALLEKEGAIVRTLKFGVDYTYEDYGKLDPVLREAEILVLSHGSKKDFAMEANCDSFVAIIERFKELHRQDRFPTEVWAVGSEIECHPAFGVPDLQIYLRSKRAYAKHAYRYFYDRDIIYRHIVPSAFTSPMGPGLISGGTAVRMAMFFIRRGFRYVPVTYTGIAVLNYFKFLARWRPYFLRPFTRRAPETGVSTPPGLGTAVPPAASAR